MVSDILYEKIDELEMLHTQMQIITNEVAEIIKIFKAELP